MGGASPVLTQSCDSTAPTVTAFVIPSTSSSLTVSISTFTATDAVGVTGYLVNESASTPSAGSGSWVGSAPTTYTFSTEGAKTLYAWAKDADGNVSTSLSDSVTITIPTVPAAPTIGTATAGNATSTVTFTAGSTGGSDITGYTVTSSPAGGTDTNAGSTSLSHLITGLTNGTAYTFTVTATNAIGTSTASAASNSVTPAAPSTLGVGLVAHYLMNDNLGTTNVLDNKGSYNGTAARNTSLMSNSFGEIGRALTFNGSTDQINTSYVFNPNNQTISFWIKTTDTASYAFILGGLSANNNVMTFYYNPTGSDHSINLDLASGWGGGGNGFTPVNGGSWHHVVASWSNTGQQVKMFIDNIDQNMTTRNIVGTSNPYGFAMGKRPDSYNVRCAMSLDDVRLYNRILTSNERTELYNGGAGTEGE